MAPSEQAVQQTADNQPTELPATDPAIPSESNATLLLAGSSSGDIPVIYATGRNFERLSLVPANWAPFGLTERPFLEGEVKVLAPPKMMPKRHTIKRNGISVGRPPQEEEGAFPSPSFLYGSGFT